MQRSGVESISDLLIPREPDNIRVLYIGAGLSPPTKFPAQFRLWDVIQDMSSDNIGKKKIGAYKGSFSWHENEFQVTPLPQEVLIIWEEHDQIFPLEKAHQIRKYLEEKTKLEVLKNTSHLPQAEDPNCFNYEALLNFLLAY